METLKSDVTPQSPEHEGHHAHLLREAVQKYETNNPLVDTQVEDNILGAELWVERAVGDAMIRSQLDGAPLPREAAAHAALYKLRSLREMYRNEEHNDEVDARIEALSQQASISRSPEAEETLTELAMHYVAIRDANAITDRALSQLITGAKEPVTHDGTTRIVFSGAFLSFTDSIMRHEQPGVDHTTERIKQQRAERATLDTEEYDTDTFLSATARHAAKRVITETMAKQ